jgi:hypothetical protein
MESAYGETTVELWRQHPLNAVLLTTCRFSPQNAITLTRWRADISYNIRQPLAVESICGTDMT